MAFPGCDIHLLHLEKKLFPQKLFSMSLAVAFHLVNRPRQQPFVWRSSSFITTPVYPSCFLIITNVNLNAFTLEMELVYCSGYQLWSLEGDFLGDITIVVPLKNGWPELLGSVTSERQYSFISCCKLNGTLRSRANGLVLLHQRASQTGHTLGYQLWSFVPKHQLVLTRSA